MLPEGLRCDRRRRGWRSSRGELEMTEVSQRKKDHRNVDPGLGVPATKTSKNEQANMKTNNIIRTK